MLHESTFRTILKNRKNVKELDVINSFKMTWKMNKTIAIDLILIDLTINVSTLDEIEGLI